MSRGRNPWIWGGAALLLGLLPWNFLGVLPLLLMLFMPRTNVDPQTRLQRLACSKCANTHRAGQRFCTNCGWDLTEVYTPEGTLSTTPSPPPWLPWSRIPLRAWRLRRPGPRMRLRYGRSSRLRIEESRPVIAQSVEAPPTAEEARPVTAQAADAADPAMAQTAQPIPPATEPGPAAGQPAEAAPATAEPGPVMAQAADARPADQADGALTPEPWGVPTPGAPPTAATMTARGMRLFKRRQDPGSNRPVHQSHRLGPQLSRSLGTPRRSLFEARQGRGRRRRPPDIERVGRDLVPRIARLVQSVTGNTAPRHHKERPPNGGHFLSRYPRPAAAQMAMIW